jgi:hypothetical protein
MAMDAGSCWFTSCYSVLCHAFPARVSKVAFLEGEKLPFLFMDYVWDIDSSFLECFPYAKSYLTPLSFIYRIGKTKLFLCFLIYILMNA